MNIRLEFKLQDLWIGVYWRHAEQLFLLRAPGRRYDVWICLVPCFPIHVHWFRRGRGER